MRSSRRLALLTLVGLVTIVACDRGSRETADRSGTRTVSGLKSVEAVVWSSDLSAGQPPLKDSGDLWVVQKKAVVRVNGEDGQADEPTDLPEAPTSALTLSDGNAYFAARKTVHAVDFPTGESIWTAKASGAVRAAPVVESGLVVVAAGDVRAFAQDTGDEAWTFSTDGKFAGSPAIRGGLVFVGDSDGGLHAIDVNTGQATWTLETGDAFGSAGAAVSSEMVVIPGETGTVWGVFAETGRERWRCPTGGVISVGAALLGDVAWVGTEAGDVVSINVLTGQERWRTSGLAAVMTRPIWANDVVYVGSDDGKLVALDAASGERLWDFSTDAELNGPPLVGNGEIHLADVKGTVYMLQ